MGFAIHVHDRDPSYGHYYMHRYMYIHIYMYVDKHVDIKLRLQLFDVVVTPAVMYALETYP